MKRIEPNGRARVYPGGAVPVRSMATFALRNLQLTSARSMFVLIASALGVAMIFGMSVSNRGVQQGMLDLVDYVVGGSDLVVRHVTAGHGTPDKTLEALRRRPEVEAAAPSTRAFAAAKRVHEDGDTAEERRLLLLGVDPEAERAVRDVKILEGRFLKPGETGALVTTRGFLRTMRLRVGDRVTLEKDYWKEGVRGAGEAREARVVGVMEAKIGSREFDRALTDLNFARRFNGREGLSDQVDLKLKQGNAAEAVLPALEKALGPEFSVMEAEAFAQSRFFDPMIDLMNYATTLVSFTALLIGAGLIGNVFALMLGRRLREVGLMRAVGMTRAQTAGLLLREAAYFGVFGSSLGLILGLAAARLMIRASANMLQVDALPFTVPVWGAALSFSAGLIAVGLACLRPALAASRMRPAAALRARALERTARRRKEMDAIGAFCLSASAPLCYAHLPKLPPAVWSCMGMALGFLGAAILIPRAAPAASRVFGPALRFFWKGEGTLAQTSFQWNLGRSGAAVTACASAFAMVLLVNGLETASNRATDAFLDGHLAADLLMYTENLPVDRLDEIRDTPGVADVDYGTGMGVFLEGQFERVEFVRPERIGGLIEYRFRDGDPGRAIKALKDGGAVLLSARAARQLNKGLGDSVLMQTAKGARPFRVAGVVYHEISAVGAWDDMVRFFENDKFNVVLVKALPGESVAGLQMELERLLGGKNLRWSTTLAELKKLYRDGSRRVAAVFKASGLIALLLVGISVFNALYLNVLERARETGVMRAVGATGAQVRRMVFAEAALVCFTGAAAGVPLGLYLMRGFLLNMERFIGFEFHFVFPWGAVAQVLAMAALLSAAGGLYPARRAARAPIAKSLRFE